LVTLLLSPAVYADDPETLFYASNTGSASGTGATGADARRARTAPELAAACEYFAGQWTPAAGEDYATVFWVLFTNSGAGYFKYRLDREGVCSPADNNFYDGIPPKWGVTVTPPVLIGGLVALGVVLLIGAWLLSRRRRISARPA
jgi:hypothetical protein